MADFLEEVRFELGLKKGFREARREVRGRARHGYHTSATAWRWARSCTHDIVSIFLGRGSEPSRAL